VTDTGSLDLNQNFTGLGAFEVEGDNFQGLASLKGDGGGGFHGRCSKSVCALA
jgi:hypothetical protein